MGVAMGVAMGVGMGFVMVSGANMDRWLDVPGASHAIFVLRKTPVRGTNGTGTVDDCLSNL
jgi:hypothetical protein